MRSTARFGLGLMLAAVWVGSAPAQREKKEEEFLKEKPLVGELLPDVTVYSPDGKEFKTTDLRGHHTVLVFGCLT